jgi:hypothetical protein
MKLRDIIELLKVDTVYFYTIDDEENAIAVMCDNNIQDIEKFLDKRVVKVYPWRDNAISVMLWMTWEMENN